MNEKNRECLRKKERKKEYVGIKQATKQGYAVMEVGGVADFLYPTSELRRGRVQGGGQVCPTITSENTGVCKVEKNENYKIEDGVLYPDKDILKDNKSTKMDWDSTEYRIRKLTPRECLRLMNVTEKDIDKMLNTVSNTQAYKAAGNSIVVSVLMAVYSQLNIKGVTPWNELSIDQKYELIDRGCCTQK